MNIHANTVVFLLTAKIPSAQVRPRRGKRIAMVLMADLCISNTRKYVKSDKKLILVKAYWIYLTSCVVLTPLSAPPYFLLCSRLHTVSTKNTLLTCSQENR